MGLIKEGKEAEVFDFLVVLVATRKKAHQGSMRSRKYIKDRR